MEHVGTKEIVPYPLYVPPLEGSLLEVLLYTIFEFCYEAICTTFTVFSIDAHVTMRNFDVIDPYHRRCLKYLFLFELTIVYGFLIIHNTGYLLFLGELEFHAQS